MGLYNMLSYIYPITLPRSQIFVHLKHSFIITWASAPILERLIGASTQNENNNNRIHIPRLDIL